MLRISNVTKYYGKQRVLNSVNMELHRGEVIGFLGPNGAGKSTMMKSILGLVKVDSGKIILDGGEVVCGLTRHNSKIGYLPELNPLYTYMYVAEYLEFIAGCYGMKGNKRRKAVERVIEQTGLGLERKKTIGQLSKGYKQRVGLAAAIIHEPPLLILDEPMTGLDPNQQEEIRNLIRDLSEDRAIMISTHIMQEVEALCSRIVIIDRGDVKYSGMVEDLETEYGSVEGAFRQLTKGDQ